MDNFNEITHDESLSVAERIRRLHVLGVSRADIARLMNKRYQHVRNTLVGPGAEEAIAFTRESMKEEMGRNSKELAPSETAAIVTGAADWRQQVVDELHRIRRLLETIAAHFNVEEGIDDER